ncbi:MAG: RluA family pseudouridine synthase [Proteobacteria bacterium]|nr:RluA family pseudouridine synthase [Cystobacterineae bacterium]MCL2259117.1 RluA family pseudouridine synthase [Cystobacterineae bacterium]MCL2314499.1 RluA family pseudouridine synthase [Pseudomonadota bacterium]
MLTTSPPPLIVQAADEGRRLDAFLVKVFPKFSRARLQRWIAEGQVRVDGLPLSPAKRLRPGQSVQLTLPPPPPMGLLPELLPFELLFEDEDLLVVNKAAGMVVHPGAGNPRGTLANALLQHVQNGPHLSEAFRLGIVHRLDKETSGVLLVAKNEDAMVFLQRAFANRAVQKTYWALAWGCPPREGSFRTLYGRSPHNRLKFTSRVKRGREAVTHFRVLRQYDKLCQLELRLETGRTHQIRVHLSEAGFPLLGDKLYGGSQKNNARHMQRQALHAWKIAFEHPRTKRSMLFEAPLPEDMHTETKTWEQGETHGGQKKCF